MSYNQPNANGAATIANSAPVNIASDQIVPTRLTSGLAATTGTIGAVGNTVTMTSLSGVGAVNITLYGTHAGVNVTIEGYDSTNWYNLPVYPASSINPTPFMGATGVLTSNATTMYTVAPLLGVQQLRVRSTAWTSGTLNVILTPSAQFVQQGVMVYNPTAANLQATVSGTVSANLNAGTNIIGSTYVQTKAAGTSALLYSGSIAATATAVKTTAGSIYQWAIFNSNSTPVYVQFFNVATGSVTLGTTAPTFSVGIPAGGGSNIEIGAGTPFTTAITVAVTTTRTGSAAPTNTVDLNFWGA